MIVDVYHPSFDVSTLSKLGFTSNPFSLPVHSNYPKSFSKHFTSSWRHHIRCQHCPSYIRRHPPIPLVLTSNRFYSALAQQSSNGAMDLVRYRNMGYNGCYKLHVLVIVFDDGGVYGGDRINHEEVIAPVVINVTIDIDHRGNKTL
ncbi:unnamed protein product [Lactuca saligna]|uniref:Uncharacterized protein n=1 Tax=Lactuca saligna TaxID=75948 RepID=A0AA35YV07_LACSI|nr:unnamed protein product [Lactuca saligna]